MKLVLRIRREWQRGSKTYRYVGANLYHPMKWYQLRFGWHIDRGGMLHLYAGRIILWQSIIPLNKRAAFRSRWYGPLEICTA